MAPINLYTEEGERIGRTPWDVYPRPRMKRNSFICLNGIWEFGICRQGKNPCFDMKINVPFAAESLLSRVNKRFPNDSVLCYRRSFSIENSFKNERVLLHVGAADCISQVFVNGVSVGAHEGGYAPFFFDITDQLSDENVIEIHVSDDLNSEVFPYGKQCEKRGGMWYTPVTGIWHTVWLESVPLNYINDINVENGGDFVEITVSMNGKKVDGGINKPSSCGNGTVDISTPNGRVSIPMVDGKAYFKPEEPLMWSPETPYLYRFTVTVGSDSVESYFALRKLEIKMVNGIKRLCLNGKPYFFHGVLDQGYWSDGLFTPADPICYEKDILAMKRLGFNTLRKHIKVEPELFYYECDRLGMIVFQDMVNNGAYSFLRDTALPTVGIKRLKDAHIHRDAETRRRFVQSMESTVTRLKNHPCICLWTIFNEGWGQFCGSEMYRKLKLLDNTRFVDTASGWFGGCDTDVESAHVYFKKYRPKRSDNPIVLSEFGGYSYKPKGHVFNTEKTYGYKLFDDRKAYEEALIRLYRDEIIPAVKLGLCAAIYTQLSDVEDETNGLLSYDRKIEKVEGDRLRQIADELKNQICAL